MNNKLYRKGITVAVKGAVDDGGIFQVSQVPMPTSLSVTQFLFSYLLYILQLTHVRITKYTHNML